MSITEHEYKEARYWQVCGAPEPPSHDYVRGWRVWFPMETNPDSNTAEGSSAVPAVWDPGSFTTISSYNLAGVNSRAYDSIRIYTIDQMALCVCTYSGSQ